VKGPAPATAAVRTLAILALAGCDTALSAPFQPEGPPPSRAAHCDGDRATWEVSLPFAHVSFGVELERDGDGWTTSLEPVRSDFHDAQPAGCLAEFPDSVEWTADRLTIVAGSDHYSLTPGNEYLHGRDTWAGLVGPVYAGPGCADYWRRSALGPDSVCGTVRDGVEAVGTLVRFRLAGCS